MTRTFNCASCSAPLDFTGEVTQKCEHCGSTVIAPRDLFYANDPAAFSDLSALTGRALKIAEIQRLIHDGQKIQAIKVFRETFGVGLKEAKDAVEAIERGESLDVSGMRVQVVKRPEIKIDTAALRGVGKVFGGTALIALVVGIGILGFGIAIVTYFSFGSKTTFVSTASNQTPAKPVGQSGGKGSVTTELLKFGGEGVGPGQFKDNRHVAIDGKGRIYSSDYSSIRVQVFDGEGKFINQWKPENAQILYDLAADKDGNLFVATDRSIYKFEGETGKQLAKIEGVSPRGIALTWDGKVVATDRRGITIFDKDLKPTKQIKDAVEQASGTIGFQKVAVGGDGTIYVTERTSKDICKFSSDGKFLNRIPTDASSINAIAIAPDGRLFVVSTSSIKIIGPSGSPAGSFDAYQAFGIAFTPEGELLLASRPFIIKYRVDL